MMSAAGLPTLDAYFLRMDRPGDCDRLVFVRPAGQVDAAGEPTAFAADWERCTLAPSPELCRLAEAGAEFHFSRFGHVRAWVGGVIRAAQTPEDCRLDGARLFTADEVEYLNAYLTHIGRRWNDVDQPQHRDERT